METVGAYCGLACDTCPVHLATLEQDESLRYNMRRDIAEKCSTLYHRIFLPEEINNCDGCSSATGRLFRGCLNCGIRTCARERKLESCAWCPDFACEMLQAHLAVDASAKKRLPVIRESR